MNVEAIVAELERLKDFVNDPNKLALENLKTAVLGLAAPSKDVAVQETSVEEDSVNAEPEPKPFKPLNAPVKKKRAYKRKSK